MTLIKTSLLLLHCTSRLHIVLADINVIFFEKIGTRPFHIKYQDQFTVSKKEITVL
jgi:hypothetical protein